MTLRDYSTADCIDSPQAIAAFLDVALEDGDPQALAQTLAAIAHSEGLAQLARSRGLSPDALARILDEEGGPRMSALLELLSALGLRLSVALVPDPAG